MKYNWWPTRKSYLAVPLDCTDAALQTPLQFINLHSHSLPKFVSTTRWVKLMGSLSLIIHIQSDLGNFGLVWHLKRLFDWITLVTIVQAFVYCCMTIYNGLFFSPTICLWLIVVKRTNYIHVSTPLCILSNRE